MVGNGVGRGNGGSVVGLGVGVQVGPSDSKCIGNCGGQGNGGTVAGANVGGTLGSGTGKLVGYCDGLPEGLSDGHSPQKPYLSSSNTWLLSVAAYTSMGLVLLVTQKNTPSPVEPLHGMTGLQPSN